MAACADITRELICFLCREMFRDPVSLSCGHSFCGDCIREAMDRQGAIRARYFCPYCRKDFTQRPELKKNIRLCGIVEIFHEEREVAGLRGLFGECTVSAGETSVGSYRMVSERSEGWSSRSVCPRSVPIGTVVFRSRPIRLVPRRLPPRGTGFGRSRERRREIMIMEDSLYRDMLRRNPDFFREQDEPLINLYDLNTKKIANEDKLFCLKNRSFMAARTGEINLQVSERLTALFRDLRDRLDTLEKRVLTDISSHVQQASHKASDQVQQLENELKELNVKIRDLETKLRLDTTDEVVYRADIPYPYLHYPDMGLISGTLYTGLLDLVKEIHKDFYRQVPMDMVLDINTAGNHVKVSDDFKTASCYHINQNRPQTPQRFHHNQVLSTKSRKDGHVYWEVEVSEKGTVRVGVACPTIQRQGDESLLGNNSESWCLCIQDDKYSVRHNNTETHLPGLRSCRRLGISMSHEPGLLTFYELCHPVRHLYTYYMTLTYEPLHAAFLVDNAWVTIKAAVE
ncbi:E3 ubiquitin/ISG15 ligase TRIM25-like [Rhinophrynus dorsalis]